MIKHGLQCVSPELSTQALLHVDVLPVPHTHQVRGLYPRFTL